MILCCFSCLLNSYGDKMSGGAAYAASVPVLQADVPLSGAARRSRVQFVSGFPLRSSLCVCAQKRLVAIIFTIPPRHLHSNSCGKCFIKQLQLNWSNVINQRCCTLSYCVRLLVSVCVCVSENDANALSNDRSSLWR